MWAEQIPRSCGLEASEKGREPREQRVHGFFLRALVVRGWGGQGDSYSEPELAEGSLFLVYVKRGKLDFQIVIWLWLLLHHLPFGMFKICYWWLFFRMLCMVSRLPVKVLLPRHLACCFKFCWNRLRLLCLLTWSHCVLGRLPSQFLRYSMLLFAITVLKLQDKTYVLEVWLYLKNC